MTIQELIDHLDVQPDKSIPVVFMHWITDSGEEIMVHTDFDMKEASNQVDCEAMVCSHKSKKHFVL